MALPSDLYTCAVSGSFRDVSGAAMQGTITFTPSATLTDSTGNVVIPAYPKPYQLSAGALHTDALVANDNADLLPTGSTYLVTVALQNLPQSSYYIQLLAAPLAFTATNATPCVFTAAGSAYANGTAVTLTGGSLPAGFSAATTYFVVSASGTSFSLAATSGGSAIASTGTGSGTVSTASVDLADLLPVVSQGTPVSYVPTSGGTYTGTVVLDGSPALQIPSGAAAGQVFTSDASGNGVWAAPALVVKPEVQEATAAALPANAYVSGVLTATSNGALTVDGIAVTAGDRVLVKNEVAAANNGVYVATSAGASGAKYVLTRSADMSIAADIPGAFIFVQQGTNNGNTGWMVTGAGPWTLGSTAITWAQFSAVPAIGLLTPTATKTANYTAASGDMVKTDTSGGSFTVTLPSAPPVNTTIGVKQIAVAGLGTNATTITCGGSDVLNKSGGPTTMTLDRLNQTVIMQYGTGGIWTVQATDPAAGQIATARQGVYYLDSYTGTDDTKMTSAMTALFAAGGGTIVLSPRAHTFANQWTTTYSAGLATAVKILGAGAAYNGAWGTPTGATTVTFTYSSTGVACMDFQHIGSIELDGVQFKSANVGVPLFFTSNATPNVHDCVWSGGATGTSCATDAIILGGTTGSVGSGDTDAYQGYAGAVYRNFFDGIRRIVKLQTFANGVQIYGNTVSSTCGTNLSQGGCIETGPVASQSVAGAAVYGNCIEVSHYPYGIKTMSTTMSTFGPNGFFDSTATCLAAVYLDVNSQYNEVVGGFNSDTVQFVYDVGGTNTVRTYHQTAWSIFPEPAFFTSRSGASSAAKFLQTSTFPGAVTVDNNGDQAGWSVLTNTYPYPVASVWTAPCTQVTDGATYSGSLNVTSLTAAWTSGDAGEPIGGTNIGSHAFIERTFTPATAIPWAASWAYSLGDITRPVSSNSHLYQCTTAGTSGSSAPTFPTGGGTVTDGTAVWTDLGTSATAVAMSVAATGTGTAITVSFGRIGTPVTMTGFSRHHILSTGAAPTVAVQTAQAGSGATASVTGFDMAFNVQFTTGSGPTTGNMAIVTTANTSNWSAAPKVSVTPKNAASAALGAYVTNTASAWTLAAANAPGATTAYSFDVISIQ